MTHGRHIYDKIYDMVKEKMCAYPQSDHVLPHWKCVLRCCAKFQSVNLPDQERDDQYSNTIPSTSFHIYHQIAHCTKYGRIPLTDRKCVASVSRILIQNNQQRYTLEKSY